MSGELLAVSWKMWKYEKCKNEGENDNNQAP